MRRSRSCRPSAPRARARSERPWRSASSVARASGVDEVAQLLLAEQLAQQVAVERQRLRAALGRGRVVLVHVRGDVLEQQGAREGGGRCGLDLDHRELARGDAAEHAAQAGQVEPVVQALAVGLEDHREAAVLARHLEQRRRLQALLPERGALPGAAPRDEQGARGVLAEAGPEQGRAAELAEHELLQLVGRDQGDVGGRGQVGVGQVQRDAVVAPDRVRLLAGLGPDARPHRERPGGVHPRAEGREHAEAPVADLVAEALHHDRAVARHGAGRGGLVLEVGDQVRGGAPVEGALVAQAAGRALGAGRHELAREAPDGLAQLVRAADALALPERDGAGRPGRRRHHDPVAGDLLDAPRGGAEHERLARSGPRRPSPRRARPPAPRRGAPPRRARGRGSSRRSGPPASAPRRGRGPCRRCGPTRRAGAARRTRPRGSGRPACRARPRAGRARARRTGRRRGRSPRARRPSTTPSEQIATSCWASTSSGRRGTLRLLDGPAAHPLDHGGALEQVAAVLREHPPAARRTHLVPGAADALHAAGHAPRALDLDDEVHRAHVDAELQAARGHERTAGGRPSAPPRSGCAARARGCRGGRAPPPPRPAR